MADTDLLGLPPVSDLTNDDQFYIVQNGNSRRVSLELMREKMGGVGGASWDAVVSTPADLVIYESQNAGYAVLVMDDEEGRSAVYIKQVVGWAPPVFFTGPVGLTGDSIMLRKTTTHIQWKAAAQPDTAWANLIALSEIKGDRGLSVELRRSVTHIQWRQEGDDWLDLIALIDIKGDRGEKGDEVVLQKSTTHVQWKYKDETVWKNLIPLSELVGPKGDDSKEVEFDKTTTHVRWRRVGDVAWINLIPLADITGPKGQDSKEIELQKSTTHVQWRRVGDANWINLIALLDLKGDKGDSGREVQLGSNATYIQWRYVGDANWTNLVALSLITGPQGDSVELRITPTHIQWKAKLAPASAWVNLYSKAELKGDTGDITPELQQLYDDTVVAKNATEVAKDLSEGWASNPVDVVVESGKFSSYHYSEKSRLSADMSATEAENSEDGALLSGRFATAPENELVDPALFPGLYSAYHWAMKSRESSAGGVSAIQPGTNIAVDSSDPTTPIVSIDQTFIDIVNAKADSDWVSTQIANFVTNDNLSTTLMGYATTQSLSDGLALKQDNVGFTAADKTRLDTVEAGAQKNPNMALYQTVNQKNQNNGYVGLGSDGKIDINYLPAIAIIDTFPVSSQAQMLALVAQKGDMAIRSDINKTFVLRVEPASVLANWAEMLSPTASIQSVGIAVPQGFVVSNPITASGTITISYAPGYEAFSTADKSNIANKVTKTYDTDLGGMSSVSSSLGGSNQINPRIDISPSKTNYQATSNNGAFTVMPPLSGVKNIVLTVTNTATAGAVTFSGFAPGYPKGDTFSTDNGKVFLFHIGKYEAGSTVWIEELK